MSCPGCGPRRFSAGCRHARGTVPAVDNEAVELLLQRLVPAIQIHYRYDGYDWTDTLMHLPAGIRLVRCRHSQPPFASLHDTAGGKDTPLRT